MPGKSISLKKSQKRLKMQPAYMLAAQKFVISLQKMCAAAQCAHKIDAAYTNLFILCLITERCLT